MDDIYGDLENYNDVNAIDELRNENKELKFKLEEYALSMDKLQKDFDKLSSEFKKLEINYSSLLKTAKAEIERKTQIIANLNVEKDMLVLNSIQNSNKGLLVLRRNMAREKSNNRKSRKDEMDSGKTNKKEQQESKKHDPDRGRNDENRLPSLDTLSSANTDDTNKVENKLSKLDSYDSESKENIAKAKKAQSLKHRRKSMPVLSKHQAKFSSDEEYEDDCSEDRNKREKLSKDDKSRKYFDRHKISETSGIDEKYSSYHESSRDTYYKGKPHRPSDKYRNARDKSRYRKHFSPEKTRHPRDCHEDDRQELFRHNRVLVSPPRDSYDTLRMIRERRPNYERVQPLEEKQMRKDDYREERHMRKDNYHEERHMQRYGFHEERQRQRGDSPSRERYRPRGTSQDERRRQKSESFERHKVRDNSLEARSKQKDGFTKKRQRDEEKQKKISGAREERNSRRQESSAKVKVDSDYDEPSSKRARIDSCSKPVDELVSCPEEPQTKEDKLLPVFAEHLHFNSCQSPDDPHHDTQPLPTVSTSAQPKEIMSTAATVLEDPRLKSKNYVKGIEGDKVILTTVTGRNVDLEMLTWNMPQVEVPEAVQEPPEYTDKMVQEMYMDIDNPVSNTSIESGEINSESNDLRMADYLSLNFYQDYENERINQIEARADKEATDVKHNRDARIERDLHTKLDQNDKEETILNINEPKLPPVRYKITRAFNPEPEQEVTPNPLGILQMQTVSCVDTIIKPPKANFDIEPTFGANDDSEDKKVIKDAEDKQTQKGQQHGRKLSAQELFEGDLALSDETSDNIFMRRQKKKEKLKKQPFDNNKAENQKNERDVEKKTTIPVEISNEKKCRKPKTVNKVSNKKMEEIKTDETTETQSDDKNNKKTRKKPAQKQKTTSAKELAKSIEVVKVTENKIKGKKSKSPEETKGLNKSTKFTYLFGDSSSLITLEDLGMETETKIGKTKKYVPICEDAQDAVDVNVNSMKKKEIETVQSSVTSSEVDELAKAIEKTPTSFICKISIPESISTKNEKDNDTVPVLARKISLNMDGSNEEVTKKPDVVKTVIISTGVQPKIGETELKNNNEVENNGIIDTPTTKVHEVHIPVALATSTPHKNLLLQLEAEVECNRSSNSSEAQRDDTSSINQSLMSNGFSSEVNNDDAPDIRIFVKRRRRLKK